MTVKKRLIVTGIGIAILTIAISRSQKVKSLNHVETDRKELISHDLIGQAADEILAKVNTSILELEQEQLDLCQRR